MVPLKRVLFPSFVMTLLFFELSLDTSLSLSGQMEETHNRKGFCMTVSSSSQFVKNVMDLFYCHQNHLCYWWTASLLENWNVFLCNFDLIGYQMFPDFLDYI